MRAHGPKRSMRSNKVKKKKNQNPKTNASINNSCTRRVGADSWLGVLLELGEMAQERRIVAQPRDIRSDGAHGELPEVR